MSQVVLYRVLMESYSYEYGYGIQVLVRTRKLYWDCPAVPVLFGREQGGAIQRSKSLNKDSCRYSFLTQKLNA